MVLSPYSTPVPYPHRHTRIRTARFPSHHSALPHWVHPGVACTGWLSMMAALGAASRPSLSRTWLRSASSTRSHVPSACHFRKCRYTMPRGQVMGRHSPRYAAPEVHVVMRRVHRRKSHMTPAALPGPVATATPGPLLSHRTPEPARDDTPRTTSCLTDRLAPFHWR